MWCVCGDGCGKKCFFERIGVTKPAIRRLARRGGVKRIDSKIYKETRLFLYDYLRRVLEDAAIYTRGMRSLTVTAKVVADATGNHGKSVIGLVER